MGSLQDAFFFFFAEVFGNIYAQNNGAKCTMYLEIWPKNGYV